MRVLVTGSTHIKDYELVVDSVIDSGFFATTIVTGGAFGVDKLAERFARRSARVKVDVIVPNWTEDDCVSQRNRRMVRSVDGVVIVWDGKSPRVQEIKRLAVAAGLPIYERIVA